MKKIFLSLAIVSALTFSATAQESRSFDKNEIRKDHRGGERFKDLNLTDAQKEQLKASRADVKAKMDAIDANTSLSAEQKMAQKEALKKVQREKMESILTPEQKAKMAEQKQKMEGTEGDKRDGMKMKEELGLSNDQAAKLKALHQSTKTQIEAVRNNTSLSEDAKKTQIKAIKENAKTQRNAMLTPDQQQKMKSMKKDHGNGRKKNKVA